jgi:hypothetical protein
MIDGVRKFRGTRPAFDGLVEPVENDRFKQFEDLCEAGATLLNGSSA